MDILFLILKIIFLLLDYFVIAAMGLLLAYLIALLCFNIVFGDDNK